jgi:polar amino acid transport system substrate-binding protein
MSDMQRLKHTLMLTFALLNLTVMGACCAESQKKQLLITTEESLPSSMSKDGGQTVYGRTADKIHEIMQRSHIAYHIQSMSWNRAFELAKTQPDTCVFSTARTAERESYFKWIGPVGNSIWVIVGPSDRFGKITQLDQIRDANIGVNLGDVLNGYMSQKGFNVVRSYDDETSLKNMAVGRLDYWASDAEEANSKLTMHNLKGQLAILFNFGNVDYYLACNASVSDDMVSSMKASLKEMKADGTADKIDAKY